MRTILNRFVLPLCASIAASPGGIERDIAYAPGGAMHTMDLQWPDTKGFATVLFVHGGSLSSGDKADSPYEAICANFVAHGVACASTNYTLINSTSNGRWPQPAVDVASAFAYLHANIALKGGDPKKIFVLGHSSGCALASNIGTDPAYLNKAAPALHLAPQDIAGVIALGCRLNNTVDSAAADERVISYFSALYGSVYATNDAAPFAHVSADNAPMLIMMADAERINPPIEADAKLFVAKARAAGRSVPIEILADRRHMTAMEGLAKGDDPAFRRVMQFIQTGN